MYFFFDIDGTLLPFGKSVPESTVKALAMLKEQGHKVFLSTGRSKAEVSDKILSLGFDGGVFAAGASIILGDDEVYHRTFTEQEKEKIFAYSEQNRFRLLVQTNSGTYAKQEDIDYWQGLLMSHIGRLIEISGLITEKPLPKSAEINKVLYIADHIPLYEVRATLDSAFAVVNNTVGLPSDLMGEIVLAGITKATGIERALAHYGADISQAVAFGDGANDIEMVESSGLGIAMGNADEELKRVADFVTDDVENDGLYNAVAGILSGEIKAVK